MMSRKDYEKIAAVLRHEWSRSCNDPGRDEESAAVIRITLRLSELFTADNPRFDTERFVQASLRDM